MQITPESAHEPVIVRAPVPQPASNQTPVSLVTQKTALTLRHVARFVLDAAAIVLLPTAIAVALGMWQLARPTMVISNATPSSEQLQYTSVALHTADGHDVIAWDVPPATGAVPTDRAIIILAGYGMEKSGILARTAFLARDNRLFYVDFRRTSTLGIREIEEARAAVAHLKSQGVTHIGVYGFTMGGTVALRLAAEEPAVSAVVTEDAFGSYGLTAEQPFLYAGPARRWLAWAALHAGGLMLRADTVAASPSAAAEQLRLPVLLVQSPHNTVAPTEHGRILAAALKADPSAETWFTDGSTDVAARTAFAEKLLAFFAAH